MALYRAQEFNVPINCIILQSRRQPAQGTGSGTGKVTAASSKPCLAKRQALHYLSIITVQTIAHSFLFYT